MHNYRKDKNLHNIYILIKKQINPSKIILFGSKSTGETRPDSDYDILILLKDVKNEREITRKIYFTLLQNNITEPVDIIAVQEEKYAQLRLAA